MSEGDKKEGDEDLSALLDSALADFGRARNTDDELDTLMAKMDAEAAEKAAKNFDERMQRVTHAFHPSTSAMDTAQNSNLSASSSASLTAEERRAAENFQKMMKALIQAEEKSRSNQSMETDVSDLDKAASEELFNRVKSLADREPSDLLDDSSWLPVMEFTRTIFAKDFMYPTVKQIHTTFLEYMGKHPELDEELKQRYWKQIDVMARICTLYESEPSDGSELMVGKAEEVCNLIMELQGYGYPPEEVVGTMPAGWSIDQSTGLPHVDDVGKAADACSLM